MQKQLAATDLFQLRHTSIDGICCVAHCKNPKRKRHPLLCQRHYMQLWRARNPDRAAYCNIRDGARRRKIPFTLTFDEFKKVVEGTPYIEGRGREVGSFHIDRVDACRGYEKGNIRVLSVSENIAKGNRERRDYEYRRQILARNGHYIDPYDDWTDDSELVCSEPTGDDPF